MVLTILCFIIAFCLIVNVVCAENATPPRRVKVLPVFFVPKGQPAPTEVQQRTLMRHLRWAQARYRELLPGGVTFTIAGRKPYIYDAKHDLTFYEAQPDGSAGWIVNELLAALKFTRYTCPYIFLTYMMNTVNSFPGGAGIPINGGFNTGGGIVTFSSWDFDRAPNVQSSIQHELGHAFGLPHVDVYGYDMSTNDSIMSYNLKHWTNGFTPSPSPGVFIPEDLRGLALNQRVFPGLRFDPKRDIPLGYSISEPVISLGRPGIPGQPDRVAMTTDTGSEDGRVTNIVQSWYIPTIEQNDALRFDHRLIWRSAKTSTGWITIQATLPYESTLTGLGIYSGDNRGNHTACSLRISVHIAAGQFRQITAVKLSSPDEVITFSKTKAQVWRFEMETGSSQQVFLRGLRFFSGREEFFPPQIPYQSK